MSETTTTKELGDAIRDMTRVNVDTVDAAAERLAERAAEDGLIEVSYATVPSPFGDALVAATKRGLVKLALPNQNPDNVLAELSERVSPAILEAPAQLDEARRELDAYFEGRLHDFSTPLDWQLIHGFQTKVLEATYAIPYGETLSYGEVAAEAGNPRAFRAAGTALGRNPLPIIVPCHRVLQAGGKVGNYGGGPAMKEALLKLRGRAALGLLLLDALQRQGPAHLRADRDPGPRGGRIAGDRDRDRLLADLLFGDRALWHAVLGIRRTRDSGRPGPPVAMTARAGDLDGKVREVDDQACAGFREAAVLVAGVLAGRG